MKRIVIVGAVVLSGAVVALVAFGGSRATESAAGPTGPGATPVRQQTLERPAHRAPVNGPRLSPNNPSAAYRVAAPAGQTDPLAGGRDQVVAHWQSFVAEAGLDERTEQAILAIMVELQSEYEEYQRGMEELRTQARLSSATVEQREHARDLRNTAPREFKRSLEDDLRRRIRQLLEPNQYGLFTRWSLDDAETLGLGIYRAEAPSE